MDARSKRGGGPVPLLPSALGLVLGIVIADVRLPWLAGSNCVLLAGLLLTVRGDGRTRRVWLAACLVGVGCGLLRAEQAAVLPADHIGRVVSDAPVLAVVRGIVVTTPRFRPAVRHNAHLPFPPSPGTRMLLAVRTCNGAPRRGLVQVHVRADVSDLPAGVGIEVRGWLQRPHSAGNPGGFDSAGFLRGRGIHAVLSVPQASLLRSGPVVDGWDGVAASLRGLAWGWLRRCEGLRGEARTLLATMVLGHRSVATPDLNDAFARTGGLHYLAVSGFHVGILLATTWWLVRCVPGCSESVAAVIALLVLGLYALVSEPNAPILRASVLGGLWCLSRLLGRGSSPANWLAAAGLLLLWFEPASLWQPGFQLSFLQVAMLLRLGPWLLRRHAGHAETWAGALGAFVLRTCWQLLVVALASWLTAAPLVALHFERIAPWGPLHSALLAPLVTLTLVAGLLALPLAGVLADVTGPEWVLAHCTGLLLDLVAWLGMWPGGLLSVPAPPVWCVLGTYALALPAVRMRGVRAALFFVLAGVLLIGGMFWPRAVGGDRLCVLDVRAGSAALLHRAGGPTWVFDVGTRSNFDCAAVVQDAVGALRMPRPVAAFVSHANLDHYSGLGGLVAALPEMRVWSNATVAARFSATPVTRAGPVPAGVEVLWPPADLPEWVSENDRSLVLRVRVGPWRVLLPGDIEALAMTRLLELHEQGGIDLRSDLLVAPHHGSVLPPPTRAFYAAVAPRVVIASSDRPRPDLEVLIAGLFDGGCRVLVTAEVGAVLVTEAGGGVRITTGGM